MRSREWLCALLASGALASACSSAGGGQCLDANGYPLNPQPELPGCQYREMPGGGGGPLASGGTPGFAGAATGAGGTVSFGGFPASAGASSGGTPAGTSGSGGSSTASGGSGFDEGGMGGSGAPIFEAGAGGEAGAVAHH